MADSRLDVLIKGKDELTPELKRVESGVIRAVGAISAAIAAIKIGSAPIKAAADFEQEMANVARTTNFASKAISGQIGDLDLLSDALLKMSLRINVSAIDLAKIAGLAGQLGFSDKLGVEGVVKFTDAVARMSSVLDISAEAAANNLGKVINIFKVPVRDIEKAISVVLQVSNKSTASGEELLDVIKRIGDAAGSLDLQQSSALAATGIDLGLSPEVVGTAFSKAFSAFRVGADKFAKVIKGVALETGQVLTGSTDEWINLVKDDGIAALKAYLAGLRKLDAVSQQTAIVKLTGGGRNGALFNKLVQDTSDSVLNNALKAAKDGGVGVAAIEAQSKKMFTLATQAKILQNSLFKLAVDGASPALGQLAQVAAKLSEALQTPQVASFVKAVVGGITDLVADVGKAVGVVASLNINWENFVKVLKVFIEIKLAQALLNIVSSVKIFGTSLKSISADAATAAAATKKVGDAATQAAVAEKASAASAVKGWLARAVGIDGVIQKTKELALATEAQRAAEAKARPAARASRLADAGSVGAAGIAAGTATTAAATSAALAAQQAALATAEKKAADARASSTAALSARVAKAEADSIARLLAIEEAYQVKRSAIKATGTEAGLKALRAEKAAQIEAEAVTHTRSLTSIEGYYARRGALQQAAISKEIQLERELLAQRSATDLRASRINSVAQGRAANGATGAGAAAAEALAAKTTAENLAKATGSARSSLFSLGSIATTTAGILAAAGRLIASSFFWITILYSIADAIGWVDKLGPAFQRVTDYLGFTSNAARNNKLALEQAAEAAKKAAAELDIATEAYKKFIDVATGSVNQKQLDETLKQIKSNPDPEGQTRAISDLSTAIGAGKKLIVKAELDTVSFKTQLDKLNAEVAKAEAEIADRVKRAQSVQKPTASLPTGLPGLDFGATKAIQELNRQIDAAKAKIPELEKGIASAGTAAAREAALVELLAKNLATTVTQQSAAIALTFGDPLLAVMQRIDVARTRLESAQAVFAKDGTAAGQSAVTQAIAELRNLEEQQRKIRDSLAAYIKEQKGMTGIPKEVLDSFDALRDKVFSLPVNALSSFLDAIRGVKKEDIKPINVPAVTPPTTGTDKVNLKSGPSKKDQAHALALARLALIKADLEAINKVTDEADRQFLAKDQDMYDRGLTAMRTYYEERKAIQLNANQADINIKKAELDAANLELDKAKKEKRAVDILRFQATVNTVAGDIKLLTLKRKGIEDDIAVQERKDADAFKARISSETNTLLSEGIIPADTAGIFKANLDAMLEQHKDFLAKLVAEGKGKLAESIIAGFSAASFKTAIAPLSTKFNAEMDAISRDSARISAAQARGSITAAEADKIHTAAIQARIPVLERQLALMQQAFDDRQRSDSPLVSPQAIEEAIAGIDRVRLSLEQLKEEQDKTAKSINKSITDSIGSALDDLTTATGSISDIFKKMLFNIANSIRKILVDDLTSRIGKSLGLDGSGGVGGYLSDVLARGPSGSANASVPGVAATAATAATDAAKLATDTAAKAAETAAVTAATGALGAFTGAIAAAPTGVVTSFAIVSGVIETTLLPILGALTAAAGSAATALAAIAAQQAAQTASNLVGGFFHDGGIVGSTSVRTGSFPSSLFAGARRMHSGGVAGLHPSEVPTILQKGEAVLTKNQQSLVAASLDSGSKSAPMNIRNVLVTDPNFVSDAMASSQGEKVLMTFIQRNRASIRQSLG